MLGDDETVFAISSCSMVSLLERKSCVLLERKLQTISESQVHMRQNFQNNTEQGW